MITLYPEEIKINHIKRNTEHRNLNREILKNIFIGKVRRSKLKKTTEVEKPFQTCKTCGQEYSGNSPMISVYCPICGEGL